MYALRDEQGTVTHSMDEIIKIAERFYARLYASDVEPGKTIKPTSFAFDFTPVTKEEVEKALNEEGT